MVRIIPCVDAGATFRVVGTTTLRVVGTTAFLDVVKTTGTAISTTAPTGMWPVSSAWTLQYEFAQSPFKIISKVTPAGIVPNSMLNCPWESVTDDPIVWHETRGRLPLRRKGAPCSVRSSGAMIAFRRLRAVVVVV